jgi:ubiquinone/menaquinone biosynthesis C-methylase UbiE
MTKKFWDEEYGKANHLTLSDDPAEDLGKFVRWAVRNSEWPPFPEGGFVLDVGCGNGRNIISLCREAHMEGLGIDISSTALTLAHKMAKGLPIIFKEQTASKPFPVADQSVDVVLDMMSTHFLNKKEREAYRDELVRIMKPYGWFFFKTFVLDGDLHAKRLILEHPTDEENSYMHPKIKSQEHVWTEEEIEEFFSPYFKIYKMIKSYKHIYQGKAFKRRTISVYMERLRD